MTVATIKTKLAALQATISGVTHAFAQAPADLNTADMPAFCNFTGQATDDYQAGGDEVDVVTRTYNMRLYVLPAVDGLPGEAERLCEPLIDAVRLFFSAHLQLGGLQGVQSALITGDSGVARLVFNDPSQPIYGVEFKLAVTEYIGFTYADNE